MAVFQYRAFTARGVVRNGSIVADCVDAAIDALYRDGLTPFETRSLLQQSVQGGQVSDSVRPALNYEVNASAPFKLKELTAFTVELASLTNSGLPLDEALRIIGATGATSSKTKSIAKQLLKGILGGAQLSQAMSSQAKSFPADYRAILGAGEASGSIGRALNQIAELLSRRLEVHGKIMAALLYPLVLILTSLLSIAVIVFVLLPSLSPVFTDAGLPLPGVLRVFAKLRDNWVSAGLLLLGIGLSGSLMWRAVEKNRELKLAWHAQLCRVPIVGGLVRLREAAAFTRALGTLLSAHSSLISALQLARTLIGNNHLACLYDAACERVPQGTSLHQALDRDELIPVHALRLIAVGEESGNLAANVTQAASMLENELQRKVERMVGMMTPLLTLTIGGGIGALIMQVMSAVLSINNLAFR